MAPGLAAAPVVAAASVVAAVLGLAAAGARAPVVVSAAPAVTGRALLGGAMRGLFAALIGALLVGCATQEFSMRSLPPESPASVNANAVRNAEAFEAAAKQASAGHGALPQREGTSTLTPSGAAPSATTPTAPSPVGGISEGALPAEAGPASPTPAASATSEASPAGSVEEPLVPLTDEDVPSMYTYDPWGRLNRFTYRFNARFDEAIFLPVANGYRRVPGPIRLGVHNFFSNLTEIDSFANYILQARFSGSARSLGRFVINSTIGIGGLFDVAKHMKLPGVQTGFSETLSTWGAHPGPYLVVPILGPSTLRDGVGYLGDYGLDYGVNPFNIYRGYQSYALGNLNAIDTRSNIDFRYYATGSPFEYEVIRFLYVRKRLIEDEALHGRGKPKPRDIHAPAGR